MCRSGEDAALVRSDVIVATIEQRGLYSMKDGKYLVLLARAESGFGAQWQALAEGAAGSEARARTMVVAVVKYK